MHSIYIATRLTNLDGYHTASLAAKSKGIQVTYDWTTHGYIPPEAEEEIKLAAVSELDGIRKADGVLAVTPWGLGTHFEMGYAYSIGIPVAVWEREPITEMKSFYRLPGIVFSRDIHQAFGFLTYFVERRQRGLAFASLGLGDTPTTLEPT